jgi:hypothetical protein
VSVTYTVSKAATTFQVSFRAIGPSLGVYTYNTRRGFLAFDLTGLGLGGIESAQLILVCASVIGGGQTMKLRSALDPNGFGATLDATSGDFTSTLTNDEGDLAITTTGTKTWTVNPANLDNNGVNYFRLQCLLEAEAAPFSQGATFASQNNGTAANRPKLRLTFFSGQVIFVNAL